LGYEKGTLSKSKTLEIVRELFNLGFDNNIMNPGITSWRMSIEDSFEEIKNKLNLLTTKK
jgi:hypothetical protein